MRGSHFFIDIGHAICLTIGMALWSENAWSAVVTQSYLSHNSTHKHSQAKAFPYANPHAPKAGELSLPALGAFNSANKWSSKGVAMQGTDYLYDTLMTSSLDEAFTMYPVLAERVTYDPDDPSWIVYHLNPKAKFWDGSAVKSADVVATFEVLLTKGPISIRHYLSELDKVQAIDDTQVKFWFKTNQNKEIGLLVGQFPIFQKADLDKNFEKIQLTPLIGSGPYRLEKVEAGRQVSYRRDPNYWGKDLMVNQGRYNFERIRYVYYGSQEVAFEGFKAGQYGFRQENKARNWATAYDFPAVKQGNIIKESISLSTPMPMQALVMNLRRPIFSDIKTRQALTLAFDFKWINKALFYGLYDRSASFFAGSELAAVGRPSVAENQLIDKIRPLILKEQYAQILAPKPLFESKADGYHRKALLKARHLLLQAKFFYQDGVLYRPDGKRAKIEILLVSGSNMDRVLLAYVRHLKRLGFDARITQVDAPQYTQNVRNYDYDMIVDVFAQSLSPGAEQAAYWGSQAADEVGNLNTAGIKNDAIDAVIAQLTLSQNREQIITATKVLDRLLQAGHYMVPMYYNSQQNLAYRKEYQHANLPDYALGLEYWWYDDNAKKAIHSVKKANSVN